MRADCRRRTYACPKVRPRRRPHAATHAMKPEIEIVGHLDQDVRRRASRWASSRAAPSSHGGCASSDKPVDWAYEITFAALLGGVVGARVYYVIQNYSQVKHDLLGSIFSGSGLVWYGGAIGGAIGVIAWMRWRERARTADARHVRHRARARLRDRADRLPGLRRRRLRDPLEPAVGDGLSPRHGADPARGARAADADLRDGRPCACSPTCCGSCATACARAWCSRCTSSAAASSASSSSSSAATRGASLGLTAPQLESLALLAIGLVWLALMTRGGGSWLRMETARPASTTPRVARLDDSATWSPRR